MGRSPSPPRRREARRERPERPDRAERDRPERVERDRPERVERDRPDRAERERPDRAERDRRRPQRSRSRSPARRRSPDRRRSPSPRRRRSASPGPSSSKPKPRKLHERPPVTQADLEGKTPEEQEMLRVMGFCGFDTTKGKKVDENDVGDVHVVLKRKYRQYMNRKGGFNRPLDFVA